MKSKLTEEMIANFSKEVEKGLPLHHIQDLFYISRTTYERWMNKGREDFEADVESMEATFYAEINHSHALYIRQARDQICNPDKNVQWSGIAWWLERTDKFFMPKQEIIAEEGKVNVILGGKIKEIKNNNTEQK